jgi:hypothetical protein
MDYVKEKLSKAQKDIFVRCSKVLAQEGIQHLSSSLSESITKASKEINSTIHNTAVSATSTISESIKDFADKFKLMGIESFIIWGYGIERGFVGLGQHCETGFTNMGLKVLAHNYYVGLIKRLQIQLNIQHMKLLV